MPPDYVDPLEHVTPPHRVEPREGVVRRAGAPAHHGRISGVVVAVHRRTPQHAEEHRLDTSVGGEAHSEVVVQVDEGDVSALIGRRVAIHFSED